MHMLRAYSWPGNVREVFAAVESAAIRAAGGRIDAQHLATEIRDAEDRASRRTPAERYRAETGEPDERASIRAALEQAQGVRARAAEILGMGRTTLWRKMKQYGFANDDDEV